jgi:hypothetical protein
VKNNAPKRNWNEGSRKTDRSFFVTRDAVPAKEALTVNIRQKEKASCKNRKKLDNLLLRDILSETHGTVSTRLSRKLLKCRR